LEADGFVAGRSLRIEYRWAEFKYERLPSLAADLIGRQVSVIAAVGGAHSAPALKAGTSVVPIVFVSAGDPVASALSAASTAEWQCDRHKYGYRGAQAASAAARVGSCTRQHGYAGEFIQSYFEREKMDVMASARSLGRKLHVFAAGNAMEIETAFSSLRDGIGALLISGDPYFDGERDRLVSLASHDSVPTVYQWQEFATIGGLMSYGTSILGISTSRKLRRENIERRQTRRFAGSAANPSQVGDQSEDRGSARSHRISNLACECGRDHRIAEATKQTAAIIQSEGVLLLKGARIILNRAIVTRPDFRYELVGLQF